MKPLQVSQHTTLRILGLRLVYAAPLILTVLLTDSLLAQFSANSDGSDGALTVTADTTLDLPDDGIFNHTTITVAEGATLTFNRNALNTPVVMLATGDILINGTVDVSGTSGTQTPPVRGRGGPGGFDGGDPGNNEASPGDGHGPGGGKGGTLNRGDFEDSAGGGAYAIRAFEFGDTTNHSENDGQPYGSPLLVPLVGGSGGAGTTGNPGVGGGGGGGAIMFASDTKIEVNATGTIVSRGGDNFNSPGQGSGGGIRLVAPTVSGTGTVDVLGGQAEANIAIRQDGGFGRIRIDTLDREGLMFNFQPISSVSIGAFMAVFPSPIPRIDIISAAGTAIPEGTGNAVNIFLPFGTPTSQDIIIQARDFTGLVPIALALIPENGSSIVRDDLEIDLTSDNPNQITVTVDLPVNVRTAIYAWTR